MPASGKIATASPSRSRRRAVRYAAAGASRSTGMWPIRSIGPARPHVPDVLAGHEADEAAASPGRQADGSESR